jgi:hypothetical protein
MARFEVKEVFRLSTRQQLVIAGSVLEGSACKGMSARIWLDGDAFWVLPIDAVEVLDRRPGKETLTALVCDERDPEAAAWCNGLCPEGTVIDLIEAGA